jgi:Zn-dependent protease with chaperone function
MSGLASLRAAVGALYSRENERQADELGIKLTAMACYDTKSASIVFNKMYKHNEKNGLGVGGVGFRGLFDSHPPSEERYLSLLEQSEDENPRKYEETSCASLTTKFFGALKQSVD